MSYEAVIKQVDVMFPPDMRDAVKAAADKCKDIGIIIHYDTSNHTDRQKMHKNVCNLS